MDGLTPLTGEKSPFFQHFSDQQKQAVSRSEVRGAACFYFFKDTLLSGLL